MWDAFISYAAEDRAEVALPLAKALQNNGLDVWFDQFRLNVGDSLSGTIDAGLAKSRYGIVVLSQYFFAKEWPRKELDALLSRERKRKKIVLPIWHAIDSDHVARHSPVLASRYAAKTEDGLETVVRRLLEAMGRTARESGLTGLWAGRTGRMRLTQREETVSGDYDWKSLEWAGHIEGRFNDGIFRFKWLWDRTPEIGLGFFICSADGSEMHGEWYYDDEEIDVESVICTSMMPNRNAWSFIRVSRSPFEE